MDLSRKGTLDDVGLVLKLLLELLLRRHLLLLGLGRLAVIILGLRLRLRLLRLLRLLLLLLLLLLLALSVGLGVLARSLVLQLRGTRATAELEQVEQVGSAFGAGGHAHVVDGRRGSRWHVQIVHGK